LRQLPMIDVLVHGLRRLKARKVLGEESMFGHLGQAQKH
jgi:hypothetical protein